MSNHTVKIVFLKSSSQYFPTILRNCKKFKNFIQEDKKFTLTTDNDEINENKRTFLSILNTLNNWKNVEYLIDDKTVGANLLQQFLQIFECAKRCEDSINIENYCFLDSYIKEGWHCKHLTKLIRHLPETNWEYDRNANDYWFNIGHFEKNETLFVIDKKRIQTILDNEIKAKYIDCCPYFNKEALDEIIKQLPDSINLKENKDWVIVKKDIDNGYILESKIVGLKRAKLDAEEDSPFGVRIDTSSLFNQNEEDDESQHNKNIPNVTFDDIGGLDKIIEVIREIIELPIKRPDIFKYLGIIPHKGILLYGPPGCGKTLIAKAIANEINAHFVGIKGPELISKFQGQSEENLRNVFEEANKFEPAIIFFDEIDSIAQKRSAEENLRFESRFVNQLLTLMDGIEDYGNVKIIASTNRPELLDDALLRPGRFDYHIEIKKPTKEGCSQIFSIATKNMPINPRFDRQKFIDKLFGCTGAEISFIAREAAYNCLRRSVSVSKLIKEDIPFDSSQLIIEAEDFEKSYTALHSKKA